MPLLRRQPPDCSFGYAGVNNTTASTAVGNYAGFRSQRSSYGLPAGKYYEAYNLTILTTQRDLAIFSGTDRSVKIAQITDGTSNTALVLESRKAKTNASYGMYWGQGLWTSTHLMVYPQDWSVPDWPQYMPNAPAGYNRVAAANNPRKLGYAWTASSLHSGGINVAFADGSVKFIKNSISHPTWYGIQTMDFGEVISSDSL